MSTNRQSRDARFFDSLKATILVADDCSLSVDDVDQRRHHFFHWSSYC
jgi:hypothetical protein